jgi:ArsR family transcriptional regulator
MDANMESTLKNTAEILRLLGQPFRLKILLVIGSDEVCVCHLEALLGLRQAAISQHLMGLRRAGLVLTRRKGRFMYYRLANPELMSLALRAAELGGMDSTDLQAIYRKTVPGCHCSRCQHGEQA